jgi:hypothetical protein
MGDRRVDANRPQPDKPQHCRELHALGERPRDQSGCDDRECHLETDIDGLRNRRRERIGIADAFRDIAQNALQERAVEPADKRRAGTKSQAVGHDGKEHSDEAGNGKARHDRVADVLLADHAAIEESKARNGHHQDQCHGGEHPGGIAGIGGACRQGLGVAGRRRLSSGRGRFLRRGRID